MKIYDISLPISPESVVFPGDPAVKLDPISLIDSGSEANVSQLSCGVHTGTHVDAPHHFMNDHRTVENLSLDVLIGPALVVQIFEEVKVVTAEILEKASIPVGTLRLLLKTRNSHFWNSRSPAFQQDYVGISQDAAEWIVSRGIKLVGIDYLSIATKGQIVHTHKTLLKPGVIILEGLNLSHVPPGCYDLYCLPLNLVNSDGAPARSILIES